MSTPPQDDLSFCWEQVLSHDPWFRLHFVFAPKHQADQILALHALFAMLERALTLSDESLSLAQLAWWRAELQPERAMVSAHPAVRAYRVSNNNRILPPEVTNLLIGQLIDRLQAQPLGDEQSLKDLCDRVGQSSVRAQLSLYFDDAESLPLEGHCAGSGLVCLIDAALKSPQQAWWFTPLSLQAKHQFSPSPNMQSGQGAMAVVQTFSEWGGAWLAEQIENFGRTSLPPGETQSARRHLIAMMNAQSIRLSRILNSLVKNGRSDPGRWRLLDMVRVWSSCR